MLLINSVIQVNEFGPDEWFGCLVQVIHSGKDIIKGYILMPNGTKQYVELNEDQYYYIGPAIITKK